jgi:hypothetical protein
LLSLFTQVHRADWPWFETALAYDNPRLPEAMIRAGTRLGHADVTECGIETLRWINGLQIAPAGHFRPIGSDSFGKPLEAPRPYLFPTHPAGKIRIGRADDRSYPARTAAPCRSLARGGAGRNKGMALFPRKVGGSS